MNFGAIVGKSKTHQNKDRMKVTQPVCSPRQTIPGLSWPVRGQLYQGKDPHGNLCMSEEHRANNYG